MPKVIMKDAMTNGALKANALKTGYKPKYNAGRPLMVICDACKEVAETIIKQQKVLSKKIEEIPWINVNTAFVLWNVDKDKANIHACPCGWRRIFGAPASKPSATKATKTSTTKVHAKCKTKGCNAILPKERKSFCYRCRPKKVAQPPDKKEEKSKVNM